MEDQTDQEIIIDLLKDQNQTLHQLLDLQLKQDRSEARHRLISFILRAIPYVIMIVLVYYVYITLKGYLDALNADIKSIQDNVTSITDYVKNLPTAIGDSIKTNLGSIGTGITNLFKQ